MAAVALGGESDAVLSCSGLASVAWALAGESDGVSILAGLAVVAWALVGECDCVSGSAGVFYLPVLALAGGSLGVQSGVGVLGGLLALGGVAALGVSVVGQLGGELLPLGGLASAAAAGAGVLGVRLALAGVSAAISGFLWPALLGVGSLVALSGSAGVSSVAGARVCVVLSCVGCSAAGLSTIGVLNVGSLISLSGLLACLSETFVSGPFVALALGGAAPVAVSSFGVISARLALASTVAGLVAGDGSLLVFKLLSGSCAVVASTSAPAIYSPIPLSGVCAPVDGWQRPQLAGVCAAVSSSRSYLGSPITVELS